MAGASFGSDDSGTTSVWWLVRKISLGRSRGKGTNAEDREEGVLLFYCSDTVISLIGLTT